MLCSFSTNYFNLLLCLGLRALVALTRARAHAACTRACAQCALSHGERAGSSLWDNVLSVFARTCARVKAVARPSRCSMPSRMAREPQAALTEMQDRTRLFKNQHLRFYSSFKYSRGNFRVSERFANEFSHHQCQFNNKIDTFDSPRVSREHVAPIVRVSLLITDANAALWRLHVQAAKWIWIISQSAWVREKYGMLHCRCARTRASDILFCSIAFPRDLRVIRALPNRSWSFRATYYTAACV